jgi:DNA-binding transcriptional MerR regulator
MVDGELLTIGELAQRTGVATSALRYYEELDILQPNARQSGQRRYDHAAVARVGVILLLREVGFSLNEIRQILRPASAPGSGAWRDVAAGKLKDLDDRIEKAEAARSALRHALAHHQDDVLDCPRFWDAVTNRLQGTSLRAWHPHEGSRGSSTTPAARRRVR